jgi:hypothetical protein
MGTAKVRTIVWRDSYCGARIQKLDRGVPVPVFTASPEMGHRGGAAATVEGSSVVYSDTGRGSRTRQHARSQIGFYLVPKLPLTGAVKNRKSPAASRDRA